MPVYRFSHFVAPLWGLAALASLAGAAHATDTTVPTASFDASFVSGEVDDLNAGLSGKAKDTDSGVSSVKARIVRNWTGVNEWWNGGGWVSAVAELACSKSAPDVNGEVTWQTTATMPSTSSQQLVPGRYTLQVIVTDASNNTTTVSNVIGVKPIDTTKPVTTITYPGVNDLQFSRLPAFAGTTIDPANSPGVSGSGVTQVGVRLRRVGNEQTLFWNGTAWVTNATQLPSMTELSWVRNSNLPSGSTNLPVSGTTYQYSILAYGVDRFNNIETPIVRTFKIVDNQAPQAQAQSINAAKNLPRPITLTATENENDAIAYTVVTPPSHGTLTGTAPNLVYTPASNYTGSDSFSFSAGDWGPSTTTATVSLNVVDDTTNPVVSITQPDAPATAPLTNGVTAFNGTSSDTGSGVASVALYLYRDWGGTIEYWTGSGWSTTAPAIDAVLAAEVSGSRNWNWPSNTALPASLSTGRYQARAVAKDYANRVVTVTKYFFVGSDAVDPTVTLTAPSANISRLVAVSGTATDADSGISQVQFRLRRSDNNQYWNGTAWTATTTALTTTVTPTGVGNNVAWTRTTGLPSLSDLPNGNYTIVPIAIDRYNNSGFGSTFSFTVANAYPTANAQSVTAIGHYGRPGNPTSITLTATDSNGDAIASYTVVTQPAHGTLTGTAPNLIYTADADYIGSDSFTFAARDFAGVDGNSATVSINVVTPTPIDVLIKNNGDANYLGDDIVNTDASEQTAEQSLLAGETAKYLVSIQKEVPTNSIILKVTGDSATAGWTVHYYDSHVNGVDITSQITGTNGWRPGLTSTDANFRLEVTAPTDLTEDAELPILISAMPAIDSTPTDVVKAVTVAQPSLQPDLTIREVPANVDPAPPAPPWVGGNVFNPDPTSQQATVFDTGIARSFNVQLKNAGSATATYRLSGNLTQAGWLAKYIDLSTGEDISAAIAAGTWQIELGATQTRLLRVDVSTDNADAGGTAAFSLSARNGVSDNGVWQLGDWADAVQSIMQTQSLGGVEYSLDRGDTWQPFTGKLTVERLDVVGFRAIKSVPGAPWRTTPMFQPLWAHEDTHACGETVWLQYEDVGTQSFDASCGNHVTGTVTVVERVW